MGNTGSALCERVKGLSEGQLTKASRQDDEIALMMEELFQPESISNMKGLDSFQIPLYQTSQSTELNPQQEEIKFSVVHNLKDKLASKYSSLCLSLQQALFKHLNSNSDPDIEELTSRLQAICRLQTALIRQQERQRRRLQKSSQSSSEKQNKKKKQLPIPARIGLEFGIYTLIDLVKIVGSEKRGLFSSVMYNATRILTSLPPLSLNVEDSSILHTLDVFRQFLQDVIQGRTEGVHQEEKIAGLAALFGFALAKGNLDSALAVTDEFLWLKKSETFAHTLGMMGPLLKNLSEIEGACIGRKILMNWNPNKLGPDIALSNENITVTRTDSSGWGCQLSEQTLNSGIHYYEFKIERNNSSCLLLGVAGTQFSNFSSKSSGAHCYTLQADGDAYMNDRGSGNVFRYGQGDRLGILVNMEEKLICFFLNGKKQSKPPFGPISDQVTLISCFGGANQYVSIINDPDIPDQAQQAMGSLILPHREEQEKKEEVQQEIKEGEESRMFPDTPQEVLKSSRFQGITTQNIDWSTVLPQEIAVYLLSCLDKLNRAYFSVFKLNEKPGTEPIKAKLSKQQPLCLDVTPEVFNRLKKMLGGLLNVLRNQDWQQIDFQLSVLGTIPVLRLIRSHLFTVLFLQLDDQTTGINNQLREDLYLMLQELLELEIQNFGGENATKQDLDALTLLKKETSLTLIHGFEVFYPTQVAKLDYINKSLHDSLAKKKLHDVHLNIQQLVFDKMSIPVNLSAAFTAETPQTVEKVQKLLDLLLEICGDASMAVIHEQPNENEYYLKFLYSGQKVLLSKAGREDFKGIWQDLLVKFSLKVFTISLQLLEKLMEEEDPAEKGKKTILSDLLSTLLLTLSLSSPELSQLKQLMHPLMNIANAINTLDSDQFKKAPQKTVVKEFSSEHPYPISFHSSEVIEIPNTKKYVLTFSPESSTVASHARLEIFSDKECTERIFIREGQFSASPIEIQLPFFALKFSSDQNEPDYGYDLIVQAHLGPPKPTWIDHVKSAANFLIVLFSKKLIVGDFIVQEVLPLENELFKYGIKDKCQKIVLPEQDYVLDEGLINISIIPGAAPTLGRSSSVSERIRKSSLQGLKAGQVRAELSLAAYIGSFSTNAVASNQYHENPVIESWIKGGNAIEKTWPEIRQRAGVSNMTVQTGGSQLDQCERTIFAVFAVIFGFADILADMDDFPAVEDQFVAFAIQQSCRIRKWAQDLKAKLLDEGKETDYAEINTLIVKKCVVILHSEYTSVLQDAGVNQISVKTGTSPKKVSGSEIGVRQEQSKWNTVKNAIKSISTLKTLIKRVGVRSNTQENYDQQKKQFIKIHTMVFDFLNDQTEISIFFEGLNYKRNKALARVIGINYLVHMYKISTENKSLTGQVIRIFSQSFRDQNGLKFHYLNGVEGVDSSLQQCIQQSFFSMYGLLLGNLKKGVAKNLDTTNRQSAYMYSKIFQALCFPFTERDCFYLTDLNMHESVSFLLSWAKGQNINQNITHKFDSSQCITSVVIHNQEEFQQQSHEGAECFSLSVLNRLEGEFWTEEIVHQKLCMEIKRGGSELPIVAIEFGSVCPQGFEAVEGNINQQGEPFFMFLKRAQPSQNYSYLHKLEVIQENPIVFRPTFNPYQQYMVKQQSEQQAQERLQRKKGLRYSAWALLKHLIYTCVGSPDTQVTESAKQLKKFKLQSLFAQILFEEVSWMRFKQKVDTGHREVAKLRLQKVSSGQIWIQSEINKPKLQRNPMAVWISKFREQFWDMEDQVISDLSHIFDHYLTQIDPSMKGILTIEEVRALDSSENLLENPSIWNQQNQLDFFYFVRFITTEIIQEVGDHPVLAHPLFEKLPKNYYQALQESSLNVEKLMNQIKTNQPYGGLVSFVELFLNQSEPDKIGIVQSSKLSQDIPVLFLNQSNDLDFFSMINSILKHPTKFPAYYQEIKDIFSAQDELPISLQELIVPQKADSLSNDFVASLLWVVHQTCSSDTMKKVLSSPKYIQELLKHMLLGASETIIVIAFRIIRSIVPVQHSPESFSRIWNIIPKDFFDKFLDKQIMESWIDTLLAFLGMKYTYHVKSYKEFIPNLSKLCVWGNQSAEFFKALCTRTEWKSEILINVINRIQDLNKAIITSNFDFSYEVGLGALGFLYMCCGSSMTLDKSIQEWNLITLKGGSLPQGHVISVNLNNRKIKIYSTEDDGLHEESLNNLDNMVSEYRPQIMSSLEDVQILHLFSLMNQLIQHIQTNEAIPIVNNVEKLHAVRASWRQIENLSYAILSSITSSQDLYNEEEANGLLKQIFERIAGIQHYDPLQQSLKYKAIRRYLYSVYKHNKVEQLKTTENQELEISEQKGPQEFKFMSEEEEGKIIASMKEEQQILVVSLKSLGYEFTYIQAALNEGLNDFQEIIDWIARKKSLEEKNDDQNKKITESGSTAKIVYTLNKEQDNLPIIIDYSGIGYFEEAPNGHLMITTKVPLDETKYMKKRINPKIFRHFQEFQPQITLFATIGFIEQQFLGCLGFIVGSLQIQVQVTPQSAKISINNELISQVTPTQNYSFILKSDFEGLNQIQFVSEENPFTHNVVEITIYDGLSVGQYGVFLREGISAALKGFQICIGQYNEPFPSFENTKPKSEVKEELGAEEGQNPRLVNTSSLQHNQTIMRLRSTGCPEHLAAGYAQQFVSFSKALEMMLQKEDSSQWEDQLDVSVEPPIVEVCLVDSIQDLEQGYIIAPVVLDGEVITNEFQMPNRKILCYKQHYGVSFPGNIVASISIGPNPNIKDLVQIGNFNIENQQGVDNSVWTLTLNKHKMGTRQPLTGIQLIACRNPQAVHVPVGFELIYQQGKAVNIAPTGFEFSVFLAHCKSTSMLGFPVTPLVSSKVNVSEHGLIDYLDHVSPQASMEKLKKIQTEIQTYQNFSIIELLSHLKEIDLIARNTTMKNLFLQIIQNYPSTLPHLLCKLPQNFSILYSLLKDNLSILQNSIKKVLLGAQGGEMSKILLQECILQLILSSTSSAPSGKLNELMIQSAHPYENNMRYDQNIRIPGASGLRIEFDPLCHTQNGCDVLRFFRRPNHTVPICEYSGRSFPDFQVEGDTVHLYFYSDASCVEWGYKFKVIPIEFPVTNNKDPLIKRLNLDAALWILQHIICSYREIPIVLYRFLQKELINPLVIFIHSCKDCQKQERAVRILQILLKKQVDISQGIKRVVELIARETRLLYHFEKANRARSALLQKLLSMITELKNQYQIELDERWFHQICDAFDLMKGFCRRDHHIYPVLFQQFKTANNMKFQIIRESAHPYSMRFTTKEVVIKGASFLEIEFDQKSKLDPQDAILLTYDLEGTQLLQQTQDSAQSDATWANEPHGPDISFSDSNRTVTRTNSSGWGCALWSEVYTQSSVKISFQIDNDGRSDYLYIGVFKADGNYRLNQVTNSDNSHDLWTWKTTGEFHKRGEKVCVPEARYRTGDNISFLINMDERTIVCNKNGNDVHIFTEIADQVIPVICFGGSNQFVSITSVESYIALANKITKKKLTVTGDHVFFHFPVNYGYILASTFVWKKPSQNENLLLLSKDLRKVKTIQPFENRITHLTRLSLMVGKHFCEFIVTKVQQEDKLQLGLAFDNIQRNGSLSGDNYSCYQSNGVIYHNGAESSAPPIQPGDRVGICIDFDRAWIYYFQNLHEVFSGKFVIVPEKNYVFAGSFDNIYQEVRLSKTPAIPDSIDLMGARKQHSGQEAREWGYKFKVTPIYAGENKMRVIECLNEKQLKKWHEYVDKHLTAISKQSEQQLVQFIDDYCSSKGKDPIQLTPEELQPTPEDLRHYQLLETLSVQDLRDMFRIIKYFNIQVEKILPLISLDLQGSSREGLDELQSLFLSTRGYIFFALKIQMFTKILNQTKSESRNEISVDRTKAMRQRHLGKNDSQALWSLFGQIYRAINTNAPRNFRNPQRIFKVIFRGEGSTDAGGPYNQALSTICDQLQSKYLSLLVPTQNNFYNIGDHRDGWIINPMADSPLNIDLFQFLGKLMGVAIRTQNNLGLSLPPFFWKRLMLEEVTLLDLKQTDESCYQMIQILNNLSDKNITPENFGDAFENITFTAADSSGKIIELVEGGRQMPLIYPRAQEYARLVQQMRLEESEQQYQALRRGMSVVVPMNLLNLFSWKQVETMVCGAPDIDVDLLMSKTEYENISPESLHVKYFWSVLREITPKDRSMFLRFVWGRSRLPNGRDFKRFKITHLNKPGHPDKYLPVAHTCFFQLDIPSYSSKEIMREKLLYAITHCQAIDLDRVAEGGWED